MEIGNYICVSRKGAKATAASIVRLCVFDCIKFCEQYGIEPVGSFQMRYDDIGKPWDIVSYLFVSDE